MKKIWLLALLLSTLFSHAQTFEGTMTWTMKTELTDPTKKAEMEKMQKNMSDPAQQEKMKKMQEQMNSPEMKAMMESNTQMKARMESTLKMMQGGGMASMMPSGMTIKIKGLNSLTKTDGGLAIETLYQGEKKQSYLLNRESKTYSVVKYDSLNKYRKEEMKHTVTKTGETMKILDYPCAKYIVTTYGSRDTITQTFWATTAISGLDMSSMSKQRMGNSAQSLYYSEINGAPLRIEMKTRQAMIIMEVTGIKKESLPVSDFIIPADFKETTGFF